MDRFIASPKYLRFLSGLCLGIVLLSFYFCAPAHGREATRPTETGGQNLGLLQAAQMCLSQNPDVRLAKVDISDKEGKLQKSQGDFDFTLSSSFTYEYTSTPLSIYEREIDYNTHRTHSTSNQAEVTLEGSQLLTNGITLTPQITVNRSGSTFDLPLENGNNLPFPTTTGQVLFSVEVPILQGLGKDVVTASLRSAERSLQASRLTYQHTAANNIYELVKAYWELKAAEQKLLIQQKAVDSAQETLKVTKLLIKGAKMAKVELLNSKANLRLKKAQQTSAEQQLWTARKNLEIVLGLPKNSSLDGVKLLDDFPPCPPADSLNSFKLAQYQDMALNNRTDLKAEIQSHQANEMMVPKARNDLLPEADVTLTLGYEGLTNDSPEASMPNALTDNVTGPIFEAKFSIELPIENNSAKGALVSTLAATRKSSLQVEKTRIDIRASVREALANLRTSAMEYADYSVAVDEYKQALHGEWMKLKLGKSTILDILKVEDNLINAQNSLISASKNWAQAVIKLRFVTGTLLAGTPKALSFKLENLRTMPLH